LQLCSFAHRNDENRVLTGLAVTQSNKNPVKGRQSTAEIILWAARWYLQFPISYRDLERKFAQRGLLVDHTTLFWWIQTYAPALDKRARHFFV
jgi:transposase-like protein